jgi:hypothetical protein
VCFAHSASSGDRLPRSEAVDTWGLRVRSSIGSSPISEVYGGGRHRPEGSPKGSPNSRVLSAPERTQSAGTNGNTAQTTQRTPNRRAAKPSTPVRFRSSPCFFLQTLGCCAGNLLFHRRVSPRAPQTARKPAHRRIRGTQPRHVLRCRTWRLAFEIYETAPAR